MAVTVTEARCSVPECDKSSYCQGLCTKHYQRKKKHGSTGPPPPRRRKDMRDRFWSKVDKTDNCWEWLGGKDAGGYGQFSPHHAVNSRAHRVAYELSIGPVPKGLVLDHLCRNRKCVNPDHLEVVTNRVNTLRGCGTTARNARKEECDYGHPFDAENTYWRPNGERYCRACHRARYRRKNGIPAEDQRRPD